MNDIYDAMNLRVGYDHMRVWKGEDGTYLILTITEETRRGFGLPGVHDRLYVETPDPFADHSEYPCFVVREVSFDMAKDQYTVSARDEESWVRTLRRPVPRPPRFTSQAEADAWLEKHTPRV